MKFNNIYKTILKSLGFATAVIGMAGCSGLDELPDNRTEIDSPEKVASLLTSGYPSTSPAVMCEYSGDNLVDDNIVVAATNNSAYDDFINEAYKWQDIKKYSVNQQDTPYKVWESYYSGISVCNHAIEFLKELSDDPANDPNYSATWGEAHVLRAYLHFVLVNIFAENYKNEALSTADRGIPYVTKVEDVVSVDYSTSEYLHNVAETYKLIEKDLLEGIDKINDSSYKVRAYHFNKNAANAFAARFYLFKHDYDKAIEYADKVLGNNPSSLMRKWSSFNMNTPYTKRDSYWDEGANCNFLLQTTYSVQWRMIAGTPRYQINTGKTFVKGNKSYTIPSTLDITLYGSGPNWDENLPCYDALVYVNSSGQQYGCYHMHLIEYFEYTDKIAGIGYVHMLYQPFSAEETLLCRAEAKLYNGDKEGALSDLNTWTSSKSSATKKMKALTLKDISSFYSREYYNQFVSDLHPAEMGFPKVLTEAEDKAMLDCILHFRRIETLHNGDRWYDIKRYGITVTHCYRDPNEDEITIDTLTYNDPRRIMQLPNSVIEAGYPESRPSSSATSGNTFQVSASIQNSNFMLYNK